MYRMFMKAKLHRATVTEANLNYVGSITIDEDLLDAVGMAPNEKVQIVNNNNGARFETYIIPGKRKSGTICLNGAAARLVQPGDVVIIISYCLLRDDEVKHHRPKVAILNKRNEIVEMIDGEREQTEIEE
ncbi:aspartate 1-decarboxylase [Fervidibacillus halotolerans]|uniref:Aspartate 1-decarboxylase n=1 Tax=Fervidibacillus halotolerans TaxID=2980027 RepID=A0A9E8M1D0_9BACI|nr:aspartate 1-decarboxylase [Fervidibacillus halotolerans]WAA13738.1 aspartate 1-decarboxylase [Fervidibacillus halotolerans]